MSSSPASRAASAVRSQKRATLKALRHSLTSQIVVFPGEDMAAYQAFAGGFFADLQPEGTLEHQFVQTLADTQWRLNRFRAHEANLFALGHEEHAPSIDTEDENIQTALAGAATLRANTDALKTLSIYEQRLNRLYLTSLKELRETKARRETLYSEQMAEAIEIRRACERDGKPFNPAEFGFVLTNAQIDLYLSRETTRPIDAETEN